MHAVLLVNSLFKTTEYKINRSNIEITELSVSGIKSKSVLLNSLNIRHDQTTPSYLPWLILFLGCASTLALLFFSIESIFLHNHLLSLVFSNIFVFASFWFISRPEKCQVYTDSFTDNILFKINKPLTFSNSTQSFINKLDEAIENAKQYELNLISLKSNARLQYEFHKNNVDELMNSGMIDEILHRRICNTMHDSVFGIDEVAVNEHSNENVVYLNT